jgi:nicotinate-nucleotide adenylyltransferase
MTTGAAPHKEIADDPGREVRMAMTRLAAAEDEGFEASSLEVDREGPSYAYETLEQLAEAEGDTELVWLMGADAALGLESWREPRRVLELARLGIARREDAPGGEVRDVLKRLGAPEAATVVDMPRFAVSSTGIRQRAAEGRPLRYLVPDSVAEFIAREGLYGASTPTRASDR